MKHLHSYIISRLRNDSYELVSKESGKLVVLSKELVDREVAEGKDEFIEKNTLSIPGTLSLTERLLLDLNWLASLRSRRISYVREKVSSNRKRSSRAKRSSKSLGPGGEGSATPKRGRKASKSALAALERSVGSIASSSGRSEEQKRAAAEILRLFKL